MLYMQRAMFEFLRGNKSREGKDLLACMLCYKTPLKQPHSLPCEHSFCAECIKDRQAVPSPLLSGQPACPLCLLPYEPETVTPGLSGRFNAYATNVTSVSTSGQHQVAHCRQHKQRLISMCKQCTMPCCNSCIQHHIDHPKLQLENMDAGLREQLELLRTRQVNLSQQTLAADELYKQQLEWRQSAEAAIVRQTDALIQKLRRREAMLKCQLRENGEQQQCSADKLRRLSQYEIHHTTLHYRYIERLLQLQYEAERLTNYTMTSNRTDVLLSGSHERSMAGEPLMEYDNLQVLRNRLVFKPTLNLNVGQFESEECDLPEPEPEPEPKPAPDPYYEATYTVREDPDMIYNLYPTPDGKVNPTSAVYLPDNRLVVAETKGGCLSVWQDGKLQTKLQPPNTKEPIMPHAVTYVADIEMLLFTDKRHWTIYTAALDGSDMKALRHEILRDPFGVAFLPSGYIVATDEMKKQACFIDPNTNKIVRTFGEDGKTPTWVTVDSRKRVIITYSEENCARIYDNNGNFLSKLCSDGLPHGRKLIGPEQIIEDCNHNLIVASGGTSHVCLYSPDARYIRDLLEPNMQQVVQWPKGLALGTNGQLAVVQGTGFVKVFDMYRY